MLPEGWRETKVDSICTLINGNGFKPKDWSTSGLPIIRIQNLNGSFDYNYYAGIPDERWIVNSGDLLFAWAGTKGVSFGPCIWTGEKGVLNQHIYKVEPHKNIDKIWLFLILYVITAQIESRAHGFKATLLHVHKKDITDQIIQVPPLPEQEKIAAILSTWDKAISTTDALLANSRQQKKALMQQLLTGKRRLPGFTGEWKTILLSDIAVRLNERNNGKSNNVVTISAQHGLIRQEEFFNKSIASENLDTYFILHKGQFAYNKSYSIGYPMGAIKRLKLYETGVVTSLYICFDIISMQADANFYEHFFESGLLNAALTKIAAEGGRAHGLLNVRPADFMHISVPLPPLDEQRAIAAVLDAADREIVLLEQKATRLREEKKALMQQLLTGKRRVRL